MADKKQAKNVPAKSNNTFAPTFRKYKSMSESEQAAFRQGAKTTENRVKERLGFKKPN